MAIRLSVFPRAVTPGRSIRPRPAPPLRQTIPAAAWLLAVLLVTIVSSPVAAELRLIDLDTSGSSSPELFTPARGTVYFTAYDPASGGFRLWKGDGTAAGTYVVSESVNCGGTEDLVFTGRHLFFDAESLADAAGQELYRSDGSEAGTALVKDINLCEFGGGTGGSTPSELAYINGRLYFQAVTGCNAADYNYALWKSDGTDAGTQRLTERFEATLGCRPKDMTRNGAFFLFSCDSDVGREPWESLGTQATTVLLKDIYNSVQDSSNPENLITIGSTTYFTADDGNGRRLWKTDGTTDGTVRIGKTDVVQADSYNEFIEYDARLFFTVNDGDQLWSSDGTAAGTELVLETVPAENSQITSLTVYHGFLYFGAYNGDTRDLWKSDGTPEGTEQVTWPDIEGYGYAPRDLVVCNDSLFFLGQVHEGGIELYKSDGTDAGTDLVADIRPGEENSNVSHLTCSGGKLFFQADNGSDGRELWVYIGPDPDGDDVPDPTDNCPSSPRVKSGASAFASIQAACDDAVGEITVKTQSHLLETYYEHVDLRSGATVTFHGGWNCGYIKDYSETVLEGSLTVSDGTAVIEQLTIQ